MVETRSALLYMLPQVRLRLVMSDYCSHMTTIFKCLIKIVETYHFYQGYNKTQSNSSMAVVPPAY